MLTYGFYNSLNNDRRYDASQISSIFDGIITDGVFMAIDDAMVVTASSGLTVNVGSGRAWFNHTWTRNDSAYLIMLPQSEIVLNRIDAVVLEINSEDDTRANSIKIIKGNPLSTPIRPTLTRSESINQYPLAYIYVGSGVTSIVQGNITNMVGTSECPFITGILQSINIDSLLAQWESQFTTWFDNLVDALDENVAATLLSMINNLTDRHDTLATDVGDIKYLSNTGTNNALLVGKDGFILDNGSYVEWYQSVANTSAVTINVKSTGVKDLRSSDGSVLTSGALPVGYYRAIYDVALGFFVLAPRGGASDKGVLLLNEIKSLTGLNGYGYSYTVDLEYMYIAEDDGTTTNYIRKYKLSDGSLVLSTPVALDIASVGEMFVDDTYIYANCYNDYIIRKLNKTTLVVVASSAVTTGLTQMAYNSTYLYIWHFNGSTYQLRSLLLSNLSINSTSVRTITTLVSFLVADDTYVYGVEYLAGRILSKYNSTTLAFVSSYGTFSSSSLGITQDTSYIYIFTDSTIIHKISKSTMTSVGNTTVIDGSRALRYSNGYLYYVSDDYPRIIVLLASNLSLISQSISQYGLIATTFTKFQVLNNSFYYACKNSAAGLSSINSGKWVK